MDKLQSTLKISFVYVADSPLANYTPASDSDTFVINCYHSLWEKTQGKNSIYLDSGAGKTVVKDFSLLTNPVKVNKKMNNFSLPVTITNEGTLVFKGIHSHPVYYVPKGPVNPLSVSQLCDHGLKISTKYNLMLMEQQHKILAAFHREGSLFATKPLVPTIHSMTITNNDWHLTLGHPNYTYMEKIMKAGIIKGTYRKSACCNACQKARIKNLPHSAHLPQPKSPFFKLYLNTLKILPTNSKAESFIESYQNELTNKLNVIPEVLHTDQGGEVSSKCFVNKLKERGICFEQGPPNSPQTNGVAKILNQSLLSNVQCIIGQSKIATLFRDEVASHTLFLLNQFPHKFLNFVSPINKLEEFNSRIEPRINLNEILPCAVKVALKNNARFSKFESRFETMRELTFEEYSDSLRVPDLKTGKIKVTRDYNVSHHPVSSASLHPERTLTHKPRANLILKFPRQVKLKIICHQ
ncbi:hypothetical protein O181_028159 [Austropuccinia psidii MF-1]|uniref:Integrase catalytic domain-containing protein n=1 Tax=Austropuccinia psidii MF-1 TaxID=1389203 RepID=A0A9Q3CNC3_9BASI|nr:hypothetical protein [Austropuccinia psidii MF-1]